MVLGEDEPSVFVLRWCQADLGSSTVRELCDCEHKP